jgi:hypothetical protein
MPEITSVETIRAKLDEFEDRMDGAITAAKTLARIKTDAERLLTDVQGISAKSEHSLQKAESIAVLQRLMGDNRMLPRHQISEGQRGPAEVLRICPFTKRLIMQP